MTTGLLTRMQENRTPWLKFQSIRRRAKLVPFHLRTVDLGRTPKVGGAFIGHVVCDRETLLTPPWRGTPPSLTLGYLDEGACDELAEERLRVVLLAELPDYSVVLGDLGWDHGVRISWMKGIAWWAGDGSCDEGGTYSFVLLAFALLPYDVEGASYGIQGSKAGC